jgi:hypothetical protein
MNQMGSKMDATLSNIQKNSNQSDLMDMLKEQFKQQASQQKLQQQQAMAMMQTLAAIAQALPCELNYCFI